MGENISEIKEDMHLDIQSSEDSLYASKKVTNTININITITTSITILWQQDLCCGRRGPPHVTHLAKFLHLKYTGIMK